MSKTDKEQPTGLAGRGAKPGVMTGGPLQGVMPLGLPALL
jgi:hypothetical protein